MWRNLILTKLGWRIEGSKLAIDGSRRCQRKLLSKLTKPWKRAKGGVGNVVLMDSEFLFLFFIFTLRAIGSKWVNMANMGKKFCNMISFDNNFMKIARYVNFLVLSSYLQLFQNKMVQLFRRRINFFI